MKVKKVTRSVTSVSDTSSNHQKSCNNNKESFNHFKFFSFIHSQFQLNQRCLDRLDEPQKLVQEIRQSLDETSNTSKINFKFLGLKFALKKFERFPFTYDGSNDQEFNLIINKKLPDQDTHSLIVNKFRKSPYCFWMSEYLIGQRPSEYQEAQFIFTMKRQIWLEFQQSKKSNDPFYWQLKIKQMFKLLAECKKEIPHNHKLDIYKQNFHRYEGEKQSINFRKEPVINFYCVLSSNVSQEDFMKSIQCVRPALRYWFSKMNAVLHVLAYRRMFNEKERHHALNQYIEKEMKESGTFLRKEELDQDKLSIIHAKLSKQLFKAMRDS